MYYPGNRPCDWSWANENRRSSAQVTWTKPLSICHMTRVFDSFSVHLSCRATHTCCRTLKHDWSDGSPRHALSWSAGLAPAGGCESHSGAGVRSLASAATDPSVPGQIQSESAALLLHLRKGLGSSDWMLRPGCCFQKILLHHIPWLYKRTRLVYAWKWIMYFRIVLVKFHLIF